MSSTISTALEKIDRSVLGEGLFKLALLLGSLSVYQKHGVLDVILRKGGTQPQKCSNEIPIESANRKLAHN